jgi:biopolymer transport protein ExbD
MATMTGPWRVRSEDGAGEGRALEFAALAQAVSDGAWSEESQVRGPQDRAWVPIGDHPQLQDVLPPRAPFAAKAAEDVEMDMTPMIDVTFQLIIFFMITATFVVQKTLDMPDPTADQQTAAALPTLSQLQAENIVVTLRGGGEVEVDGRVVPMDQLTEALREASRKNPDNVELILDVEDQVEYETVVRVIDGAAGAQIEKVHFLRHASEGAQEAG